MEAGVLNPNFCFSHGGEQGGAGAGTLRAATRVFSPEISLPTASTRKSWETQLSSAHPPQKASSRCSWIDPRRGAELPDPPPTPGLTVPTMGGKRERNQKGEWEKRKPERWKNPSLKSPVPKEQKWEQHHHIDLYG